MMNIVFDTDILSIFAKADAIQYLERLSRSLYPAALLRLGQTEYQLQTQVHIVKTCMPLCLYNWRNF